MKYNKNRKTRKTTAQAMVEFALVAPLLFLLMFGIIESGRLLFVYGTNVTAARTAARYGSATGDNDSGVPYYRDCAGIKQAVKNMGFATVYTDADIHITYDRGPDPADDTKGIAISGIDPTPGADTCSSLGSSLDTILRSGDRIVIQIDTNWAAIVSGIVPIPSMTLSATSVRTIISGIDIAVTAPAGYYSGSGGGGGGGGGGGNTNTPTKTYTPPNTSTPSSATAAFTPTKTLSPTVTYTITGTLPTLTPSNTPSCISTAGNISISGNTMSYTITNSNLSKTMTINDIRVSFNNASPAGQTITKIRFNGTTIWSGNNPNSPAYIANFQDLTTIDPLGTGTVEIVFSDPYVNNPFSIEQVTTGFIEEGCYAASAFKPTVTPSPTLSPTSTSTLTPTATNTPCTIGNTTLSKSWSASSQLTLSWTSATNATQYEVHRSTTSGFTPSGATLLTTINSPTLSYSVGAVTANTNYYFKVVPKNSCVTGNASNQISARRDVVSGWMSYISSAQFYIPTGVTFSGQNCSPASGNPPVSPSTTFTYSCDILDGAGSVTFGNYTGSLANSNDNNRICYKLPALTETVSNNGANTETTKLDLTSVTGNYTLNIIIQKHNNNSTPAGQKCTTVQ